LAAKLFWLRPSGAASWLSPEEVVARLKKVFDHVSADHEGARKLGDRFVSKYRMLLQAGLGAKNSTPLEIVERQWRDAVIVQAWDVSASTVPFQIVVKSEHRLELVFPAKAPFQEKRRAAEKAAVALGYAIEHFDPEE